MVTLRSSAERYKTSNNQQPMMAPLYLLCEGDTETTLPVSVKLQNMGLGLFEIFGSFQTEDTGPWYLCCDVIYQSIVGEKLLPVIRELKMTIPPSLKKKRGNPAKKVEGKIPTWKIDEIFAKPIYVACLGTEVNNFRLYILDKNGNVPSLTSCRLNCTLLPVYNKYSDSGWQ